MRDTRYKIKDTRYRIRDKKQQQANMDTSLNKYISDTGFCSRREADRYIEECRVTINGKDAHKGNRVKEGDIVLVDGEPDDRAV